ncbi:MAG: hypothetical protein ACOCUY_01520, partial [Verrucomicrobiota bacterium]
CSRARRRLSSIRLGGQPPLAAACRIFKSLGKVMQLKLRRKKQFADFIRKYEVYVDGRRIGEIGCNENKEFEIPDGRHHVHLKIDWCSSNTIFLKGNQETVRLTCWNTFWGWRMLTLFAPIYYITLGRQKYLTLKKW